MSNSNKEQTEELIKTTVKDLLFVQGRFDATTQEIADEAGVNRTLINYYFRSRDNLMKIVFQEALEVEKNKSKHLLNTNLSFKENVALFIEKSLETNLKCPFLETYITTQMNKGDCPHPQEKKGELIEYFHKVYAEEVKNGNIDDIEPMQFLLNLISLLVFPSAARPLIKENFDISDSEYDRLISERKDIILNILFKKKTN